MSLRTYYDKRGNSDPSPNDLSRIFDNITASNYYHKYDKTHMKHDFRFTGILRYLDLTTSDLGTPLFVRLDKPEDFKDPQELLLLVQQFFSTFTLLVSTTDVTPRTRYNWIIANALRAGVLKPEITNAIYADPRLINYELGENPFQKFIISYGQDIIPGIRGFHIPNSGVYRSLRYARYTYDLIFIDAYDNDQIDDVIKRLYNRGVFGMHVTWSWNAFHIFKYTDIDSLRHHLCTRILETWTEFRNVELNRADDIQRPTQVIVPLLSDKTCSTLITYAQAYDFQRLQRYKNSDDLVNEMLEDAKLYDDNINVLQKSHDLPYLHLPKIMEGWRLPNNYNMYSYIFYSDTIRPQLRSNEIRSYRLGEVVKHLEPFGELITNPISPVLSAADENVVKTTLVGEMGSINDDLLDCTAYMPDIVVSGEDILEQQQDIIPVIAAGPTKFMTDIKNMQNFGNLITPAAGRRITSLMNGELIALTLKEKQIMEVLVGSRIVFSERYNNATNSTIYIPIIPDVRPSIRYLNSSTFKMMALFLHCLQVFENVYNGSIKPSILFLGVENEPAIDIIRMYYKDRISTVSGIGAQALNHTRAHVGVTPTLPMNADIIISDINFESDNYNTYLAEHEQIFKMIKHASICVMKLQVFSSFLFNALLAEQNTGTRYVLLPNGRKTYSMEAYLYYSSLTSTRAVLNGYSSDHPLNLYTTKSYTHDESFVNDRNRVDRLDLLTENELDNMDAYFKATRANISTLRVKKSSYIDVRDQVAQLTNRLVMFSTLSDSDDFISIHSPDYTRLAMTSRRRHMLGDTEETTVSKDGFGLLHRFKTVSLYNSISMYSFIKMVLYARVQQDIRELIEEPANRFECVQDIGCRNLTGMAVMMGLDDLQYFGYDVIDLNTNALINNDIVYTSGVFDFENDEFMDRAIILIIFTIHNPIANETPKDQIDKIIANIRRRTGSVVYVTFFNTRLVPFILGNGNEIQGVHLASETIPGTQEIRRTVVWKNYPPSTLVDEEALIEEYADDAPPNIPYNIVPLRLTHSVFTAVHNYKVTPYDYRASAMLGLLDGVSLLRLES
ncbi:VP4 [Erinnyis ello cypovirus 2]|nr:VP4 [Erinnyis ello cypovirus 2]